MYKRSLVDLNLYRHEESQSRQKALKAVAVSLFFVSPLPRPQIPLQQDLPADPSALSHPTQGRRLETPQASLPGASPGPLGDFKACWSPKKEKAESIQTEPQTHDVKRYFRYPLKPHDYLKKA